MLLPLVIEESSWIPHKYRHESSMDNLFKPLAVMDNLVKTSELFKHLVDLQKGLNHVEKSESKSPNGFQANFDVQHFQPEEINVKVDGNTVTVEAKHEEKRDEHGQISRHFVRKYKLPKTCNIDKLESRLSSDGVLTISAPLLGHKNEQRNISIVQTGKPARALEEEEDSQVRPKKKKKSK